MVELSRRSSIKFSIIFFKSAAIDYKVSQVVDIVKGIHGVIPKDILEPLKQK